MSDAKQTFKVHYSITMQTTVEADSLQNAQVAARRKINYLYGPLARLIRIISPGVERGNPVHLPPLTVAAPKGAA